METITLPYNKRVEFDYERFMSDIKKHYKTLPPVYTDLGMAGRISRETGISRDVVKYALQFNTLRSFDVILRLAGWAGIYLDEYRK